MDEQRLADYLAGELSPDEHAALEQQLADDAALRARLARMRAADEALGSLSSPEPRPGFEGRLHAALAPEVAHAVGGAPVSGPAGGPGPHATPTSDELAARRSRGARTRWTWPRALGGAAAGVALLAIVGIAVSGLPTGQEDEVALDAAPETADMDAAEGQAPILLATDRELDDRDLADLLEEPTLTALARRHLDQAEGSRLAEAFRAHFADDDRMQATSRQDVPTAPAEPDDAPATEADEPAVESEADDAAVQEDHLDARARADMRRCLTTLLEGGPQPVPAYAEATTYQGEAVIVYGLVGPGADGQRYDRLEVWVLERDDCQVRTFQQRDH